MENFSLRPKTDPTSIYIQRDGMYAPELVAAATIGLDFFSWLSKSPADQKTICASLGLADRPVDVMLTLFCAMGYLDKKAGAFDLTDVAREFLVRDSPWFVGPYFAYFKDRPVYQGLLETLRTDKPGGWSGVKARKPWAEAMQDDAFAHEFTGSMDARGVYVGPIMAERLDLKSHRHVLDIAGGSGIYACCIAAAHPHMKATVFDRSPVDRVAAKCIAQRGYSDRVSVASGDMFQDPFPAGCDVHLWSNAFHDWDAPTVQQLAAKSFAALPSRGLIVVHDRHLNREKTGPLRVAAHSVFLMAGTAGRYYSVAEIEQYLAAAGFADFGYREVVLDYSVITARKP
ncbi:MAG TPA: methyltransferase [Candidatus Baltobacteraceae bacterium]|nr:methyltransferase [Candidatus Baltobacteraceae bacterium]